MVWRPPSVCSISWKNRKKSPICPTPSRRQRVSTEGGRVLSADAATLQVFADTGGFGSMGFWFQRGLGGADLAHPSSAGAEVLGEWVYLALMEAYDAWKAGGAKPATP